MFHVKHSIEETIAAIATPLGAGGVGVVRISGRGAKDILLRLFLSSNGAKMESHRMLHGWIKDPKTAEKVDEVLACFMQAPKSYTGEDVVEVYCHGGIALVQKVLNLFLLAGARFAQRGEFTRRAFLNRKIDLAQAEAVLDLIQAPTQEGAGLAVKQLEGKLSKIVSGLRERLIGFLAGLEAEIDFPDDVADLKHDAINNKLEGLIGEIDGLLESSSSGRIYREGLATVILGKPNVGKSSLLNALLREKRAIVTNTPGTTRDSIEETININGLPLRVIDTAGLRRPKDRVERFGVERTERELAEADITLIIIDASSEIDDLDRMVLNKTRGKRAVVVLNKIDLGEKVSTKEISSLAGDRPRHKTSALLGEGIQQLEGGLFKYIQEQFKLPGKEAVVINSRHQGCLRKAKEGLLRASGSASKKLPVDFITIDIKDAVLALGEITGELVSEEVINTIFEQFCVGK